MKCCLLEVTTTLPSSQLGSINKNNLQSRATGLEVFL
jgi:hypothetical protein